MRPILFILLMCFSLVGMTQKPIISGYLGKVNYAMLRYNTGARFSHPEKWKRFSEVDSRNYSGVSAKSELEATVGHIFSNRFVVEGIVGYNNLSMDLVRGGSSFYYQSSSGFQRGYDYYLGHPKITDLYAGIATKFYKRNKGALAPIGLYYGLKMNYHAYAVTLDDIIAGYYTGSVGGEQQVDINYGKFSYKFIEFSGTFGYTRAVADNLILDYGFSIGWGAKGPQFYDPRVPFDLYFESNLLDMIKRYQVGKIHLGLGYMF